jgi:hypothetical protein
MPAGTKVRDTNPFAGLSFEQLKETCLKQYEIIERQTIDINSLLSNYITFAKQVEVWGGGMISSATTFLNFLSPTIRARIPTIEPGSIPEEIKKGPMSNDEIKKLMDEEKKKQLETLQKEA